MSIDIRDQAIRDLCSKWNIKRLRVFGSVARREETPESDVDLLVEFGQDYYPGWEIIDIEKEFSKVFGGRRVQIIDPEFLNRWIKDDVLREARDLYVAA